MSEINSGLFTSDHASWETPQKLFDRVSKIYGPFDFDAAASQENAKCERYFDRELNGLAQPWRGRVWLNPPYGDAVKFWVRKCALSRLNCEVIVALLPARTDTRWFHQYVLGHASRLVLFEGRIKFVGAASSAPFPSILAIYYPGGPQDQIYVETMKA